MTAKSIILGGTLAFTLIGCGGGAMQTGIGLSQDAAAGLQRNINADDLAVLKRGCADAAPALAIAADPAAPKTVSAVAVYPAAFCKDVLAGVVPATANANSVPWLSKTLGFVDEAAKVAGYVLPVALKLMMLL